MQTESAYIIGGNSKRQSVELQVADLSFFPRLKKTFLKVFLILIVGVMIMPIPLLHIIGPLLAIAFAIKIGISTFRERRIISSGLGKCPDCEAEFKIMRRQLKFPFFDVCEACHREVKVVQDASA